MKHYEDNFKTYNLIREEKLIGLAYELEDYEYLKRFDCEIDISLNGKDLEPIISNSINYTELTNKENKE